MGRLLCRIWSMGIRWCDGGGWVGGSVWEECLGGRRFDDEGCSLDSNDEGI